ncbi:MAG: flagellar biosynthesis anti-sigma factor FlgM [Cellvibrionaceae bacterium]|nr:flagellar biosynthesis anti-sigma factor FlgM [Cellvibrionaceae bacterium]
MVIDPGNNINTASNSANKTRQNAAPAPQTARNPSSKPPSGDSVSLSTTGQNLAKLEAAVAQSPEVDEAKVAELKAAINSGRYQVDADRIADKMLSQDADFD